MFTQKELEFIAFIIFTINDRDIQINHDNPLLRSVFDKVYNILVSDYYSKWAKKPTT